MKAKGFIKSIILIIIFASFFVGTITGCSKKDENDINKSISSIVNEIEKNNYELNTLEISFSDYTEKTDKYLSKYFNSFYPKNIIYSSDNFVYAITGKHYEENDWKNMSLDELKQIGEPLIDALKLNTIGGFYNTYEISKVYDDSNDSKSNYKNVFIKHSEKNNGNDYILYKQYTFKKEGSDYVLFSIRNLTENYNKELKYGDKVVEFAETINLK